MPRLEIRGSTKIHDLDSAKRQLAAGGEGELSLLEAKDSSAMRVMANGWLLRMLSLVLCATIEGISGVKKNRIKGSFFPLEYSQKTTGFILCPQKHKIVSASPRSRIVCLTQTCWRFSLSHLETSSRWTLPLSTCDDLGLCRDRIDAVGDIIIC